jgi:hypothetical protein
MSSRPSLAELPQSPVGRTGWPWTVGGPRLPARLPDGSHWPRVSIVTPSLNQGEFIEETIRSVLLQGYPDLEYAVVDGGSGDATLDIIRRYEPWLAWWVSEPDRGQVYAVQRGWGQGSGEILAYLNSDDAYLPGAVGRAVASLSTSPQSPAVSGGELRIDRYGAVLKTRWSRAASLWDLLNLRFISQPATFVRREALDQAGGLDTSYEHAFDFELWLRIAQSGDVASVPAVLAATRWYPQTKTLALRPAIAQELQRAIQEACRRTPGLSATQRRQVLSGVQALAASLYMDSPGDLGRAAICWWDAFAGAPERRRDLLRMPAGKTVALLKRVAGLQSRRSQPGGPHWSEWAKQMGSTEGVGV